jgi:Zn-dependent peptidase ImmA (M78 family)
MSKTFRTLREVREKLLGYRFDSVVRLAPIPPERLEAIEGGEAPTFLELDRLARLYGVDMDVLCDEPIALTPGDGVEVLTRLDEFRDVDDITRSRIVVAANAAKDLISLYARTGVEDRRTCFQRERPRLDLKRAGALPYQQGATLASQMRSRLGIGNHAIRSLRDLVAEQFPSLTVLHADLGSQGPAGLGLVDRLRGPVIVLNSRGKNENPCVRRFSLAHELCHMLIDWNGQEPLATISGYFNERDLERERRANAFAVRFLCPPRVLQRIAPNDEKESRKALRDYGIPYAAWRLYVRNERNMELSKQPPSMWGQLEDSAWADAEEPLGIASFPLSEVPTERRTRIAELAARLYSAGEMPRDEFAEMLGVTPAAELERVLDYFAFDLPDESNQDAA